MGYEGVTRIGVISDTHGLLRPQAVLALEGVDLILHAGDIGSPDIITKLTEIAPTMAIRGNIDRQPWAEQFPPTRIVEVDGRRIFLLHNLKEINLDPAAESIRVVISGHSHKPAVWEEGGVLYLNPGSAGPRRFTLPVAVASLQLDSDRVKARIHELSI